MLKILVQWILYKTLNRLLQNHRGVQLDLCIFGALPPIQHFSDDRCPLMMQNELLRPTSWLHRSLLSFVWFHAYDCADGEVEELFTSTTVRTRDTVFPLFGDAGTKSATEAELQEFGESVRARPDEAKWPSLALRRPVVEPEEGDDNLAAGEEMQVDREQPDPEELRRRAAEASADAAGARPTTMGGAGPASAEPRRRIRGKRRGKTRRTTRRRRRWPWRTANETSASRSRSSETACDCCNDGQNWRWSVLGM